jgi:hypothetical protein
MGRKLPQADGPLTAKIDHLFFEATGLSVAAFDPRNAGSSKRLREGRLEMERFWTAHRIQMVN